MCAYALKLFVSVCAREGLLRTQCHWPVMLRAASVCLLCNVILPEPEVLCMLSWLLPLADFSAQLTKLCSGILYTYIGGFFQCFPSVLILVLSSLFWGEEMEEEKTCSTVLQCRQSNFILSTLSWWMLDTCVLDTPGTA